MATILRPPLVSQGQPKRPIAPVDYFSRPLTLGINPNARIAQLSDSAPQRMRRIHLDVYPNLLGTTLGAPPTLDLPLRSGRVFESAPRKRWQADSLQSQGLIVYDGPEAAIASLTDSAPQRRKSISLEQATNLLGNTLGQAPNIGLPLIAEQLDDSAPARKPQVRVEALQRPITLGVNPNAAVAQLSDSATPAKKSAYSFDFPNLLAAALQPEGPGSQQSESAPPQKRPAYSFDPPNLFGTTLQSAQAQLSLPLSATRIDWSAPTVKFQARTELLYRPLTLGIALPQALDLPLTAGRVDLSAPAVKYQVRIEALSRHLTLGINPNADVLELSDSATVRRKAAYAFDAPNLLQFTLAESIGLPLTAGRLDASAPTLKYQVRVESLYRSVTLGINPNALVAQLSASAPPPKKSAYTFDPPNLIGSTLAEPLGLPRLAVRMSWSAPEPKSAVYLDTPANRLLVTPLRQRVFSRRVVQATANDRVVVVPNPGRKLH